MILPEISWAFRLLLTILTCYRLAKLIADDDGPLFIFKRLRYWAKDNAYWEMTDRNVNFEIQEAKDRWFGKWYSLAEGLECPYCVGVWVSLPLFFLLMYPTYYGDLFLILMSISGGQAFLQSLKKQ